MVLTVNDAIPWAITVIALLMLGIAVIWLELMRTSRMLDQAIKERDAAQAAVADLRLAIRFEMRKELEKAIEQLHAETKTEQQQMQAPTLTPSVELPYAGPVIAALEPTYDVAEDTTYTLE